MGATPPAGAMQAHQLGTEDASFLAGPTILTPDPNLWGLIYVIEHALRRSRRQQARLDRNLAIFRRFLEAQNKIHTPRPVIYTRTNLMGVDSYLHRNGAGGLRVASSDR